MARGCSRRSVWPNQKNRTCGMLRASSRYSDRPLRANKCPTEITASSSSARRYACRKRDEGMGLTELRDWVEDTKLHLCHWFTVDDLMYLKRGGRISSATALVGTMLQIKPLLHVDDEGHLISMAKARGRKASLDALARKARELGAGFDNSTMFISHGDCPEDAQYLASVLKERYGVKEVVISYVGAVIGSHSGPGTMALFFLGEHR